MISLALGLPAPDAGEVDLDRVEGLCADRTGHVLAAAGSQMYIYKVVQSAGKFKDEGAAWTAQEIAENWDAISKV